MEKKYSQIVGTPVYIEEARSPVTTVKDLVVDCARGKVIGFIVDINKNLVVAPIDILEWNDKLVINGYEAMVEADEILRIKEALDEGIFLLKNKVETEEGKYLGKVFEYTVNTGSMMVNSLYVAKGFLGLLRYEQRIIGMKHVLEVKKEVIVVKDEIKIKRGALAVG